MSTANCGLLVCQLPPAQSLEEAINDLTIVKSPVACMDAAITKVYEGILIYFLARQIRARDSLIELCTDLNKNPLIRSVPKCVSLDAPHRLLLAKLREVGIEYVDMRPPAEVTDPWTIWERTMIQSSNPRIEALLSRLCPFLNYMPISDQNELITCAAYRNRMVLGGKRLHEVCQAETHLHCEFYLNPRAAA